MGIQANLRAMVIRNLAPAPKGSGVALQLVKEVEGAYDPETSAVIPGRTEVYEGSGLRVNYKTFDFTNTAIQYGDFKVYLSPILINKQETPPPLTGDVIVIGGERATVLNIEAWDSNELACGWKLQVRN